jgi:hypothetical protein
MMGLLAAEDIGQEALTNRRVSGSSGNLPHAYYEKGR